MTPSERIGAHARNAVRNSVVLAALTTIACSDPLSPREISGMYVLELFNGAALPAACPFGIISGFERGCTVLADTVRINDDGSATFGSEHRVFTELRPEGEVNYTAPPRYKTFEYVIRKDVIVLTDRTVYELLFSVTPSPASRAVPQQPSLLSVTVVQYDGRLAGDILTLYETSNPGTVHTFRRVDTDD